MERPPLFSVIVTTFDRPELVREALASVRAQTVEDFECIVVNDGTIPVELPDDDRFYLIDKREAAGMAASINVAIQEARGRYLTFLDDDDAYTPNRLELAQRGLMRSPFAVCWRANYDTGIPGRNRDLEGWVNDVILDRSPPMMGQAAIERSRMIPLDERLRHASDIEWWTRVTAVVPVTTVPEVGLLFRRHPLRTSSNVHRRYSQRVQLYAIQESYFRRNPRAAARFHKRTGLFALEAGFPSEARHHLWTSLKLSKDARVAYHFGRALLRLGRAAGAPTS